MAGPWTLVRTLTISGLADDTDWVAAGTPPATGAVFSLPAINGQVSGGMKVAWLFRDSGGQVVAPSGTYSYRLIEVVDPTTPAALNYASAAVVAAAFGSEVYLATQPSAGAMYALRVYTVAGTPVGAETIELYVKGAVV